MIKAVLGWLGVAVAVGGPFCPARAQDSASQASVMDELKTLVGTWTAQTPKGEKVSESIRSIANGSALEETQQVGDGAQAVAMYAANSVRIVMTYYGATGNQPRMQTNSLSPGQSTYEFTFVDVTNLPNAMAGHMQHLKLQVIDTNHFDETWTWREKGADKVLDVLHFTRAP